MLWYAVLTTDLIVPVYTICSSLATLNSLKTRTCMYSVNISSTAEIIYLISQLYLSLILCSYVTYINDVHIVVN